MKKLIRNKRLLALTLLFLVCYGMLGMRMLRTNSITFVFLAWNLVLAAIPVAVSSLGLGNGKGGGWKLLHLFNVGLTVLFLPNAPYIITDMLHLRPRIGMPFWFDTLLLFAFAFAGLWCYFLSIREIAQFLARRVSFAGRVTLLTGLHFLCGFGIYLGRFLRFNSWDLMSHPLELFGQIAEIILHPAAHPRAAGMTLSFGLLLCFASLAYSLLSSSEEVAAGPGFFPFTSSIYSKK